MPASLGEIPAQPQIQQRKLGQIEVHLLFESLGFTALVFASLPAFFGGLVLPETWIGLLGILPIIIGISHLMSREKEEENLQAVSINFTNSAKPKRQKKSLLATLKDRQTYRVSAVTIANGGNNIGIYVPLFAGSNIPSLAVISDLEDAMIPPGFTNQYQ
ncbi:MAG: cadmium resistance transporter [Nostoc sp. C3-bin3]|nr:cadmium resistance transporter [Nostoc sp. C3-bin3]